MRVDTHNVTFAIAAECREIGEWFAREAHGMYQDAGNRRDEWTRGTWDGTLPGDPADDEEAESERREVLEQLIDDAAQSEWDRLWDETERERSHSVRTNCGLLVTACAMQSGSYITTITTIDGNVYSHESVRTDGGYTDAETEAQCDATNAAAMLNAGMIRRRGDGWQIAANAELPVPAGYVAEWD